ncbi:3-oxoacyl-[acyl-carrier-protein] reductase [Hazenella sp. IB182357]|uniref:3-oxoacyl-[acyl-carrier-protein] reductase n=1 Tax=Polycladospora coralii TaxID=2771432 RepID=A0A926N9I9_9BACL|nr:3-oxoacyl-[acyl-carrier-protein] reductase [Polycladospora coralii]MBD1371410.1 3-oxoacyl-[acyl-carrier-protein] reductase [Polycladospora coralii]
MLTDQVALVTGGSRGIGRAIALSLASVGANIVIFYAGNKEAAEQTVQSILEFGVKATSYQVDVSKKEEVDSAIKEIIASWGHIDILVNNAGITRDNLLMRMKEDEWDEVINTNLKGYFLCTKAVARPMLKQRSGRIINIGSVVGITGNTGQANYAAAKAGVIGLTKTTARELASRGITVNCIAPGFIKTEMTDQLDQGLHEEWMKQIPLKHFGESTDVAEAVKFVASSSARYITGQTIHVDGGLLMG